MGNFPDKYSFCTSITSNARFMKIFTPFFVKLYENHYTNKTHKCICIAEKLYNI